MFDYKRITLFFWDTYRLSKYKMTVLAMSPLATPKFTHEKPRGAPKKGVPIQVPRHPTHL